MILNDRFSNDETKKSPFSRHLTGRGRDISIPSGHINDGYCDCCDGSDEWLELTKCQNTCANT